MLIPCRCGFSFLCDNRRVVMPWTYKKITHTSFLCLYQTKTNQIMEYPIQHSISKVGLPLIVTTDNPNLCFLVDTGATHNILFGFIYEHIKSSCIASSEKSTVIGIDGEKNEAMQIEISLSFGGQNSKALFSVIDTDKAIAQIQSETGIQIHGILGIPFLIENKWILDFNNLKIKSS